MNTHPETFLRLDELGTRIPPYRPTFDFPGPFIDSKHRSFAECPLQDGKLIRVKNRRWFGRVIPGWLRREDALKLYELSFFANGDILELGCCYGLSTSILALASRNSGHRRRVYTVDLDCSRVETARRNLKSMGLHRDVAFQCGDGTTVVRQFAAAGKRFGLVFIDHSHEYQPVREVCQELPHIITAQGFCLFHDFNAPMNRNPDDKDYKVYQAVMDGLDPDRFEFCGVYGCTALYRAHNGQSLGAAHAE
jgi:SAM-dependent methyltransferase